MASGKTDLTRAGTMQMTADDGKSFLDRNLTDWKKPYLMDQFEGESESEEEEPAPKSAKKAKLSKHTTMKGTAKEAAALLAGGGPDEDVLTRGQQKKLEVIKDEKPTPKKSKLARDNTMAATAKEGKSLVGKEKLGDTRQVTKAKKRAGQKRSSPTSDVVDEAEQIYGKIEASEGRSLRKRPARPVALKKAGTMQKTAKEGKAFLKRTKKSKK